MAFTGYSTLQFSTEDRVLTVTIDSPGPMNAVNQALHDDLARVFLDVQDDPHSDIVVLTGAGSVFCAGGDARWMVDMLTEPERFRGIAPHAKRIVTSLLDLEKPILCRLNGAAAGLGATIALMCDIVIADETAVIGDPHVKMGFVAGDGGAVIWPQLIGYARAKELLMTGDMIKATDAVAMGLINYAVPGTDLDAKVAEMVTKVQSNPRWAVRWTKTVSNMPLRDLAHRLMDASVAYEMISNTTRDHREAVAAFLDKRKPNFTGE